MRLRVVLVWMLLALLPVRGWATLVMQVQPPAGRAAMAAQPTQAPAPCHQMTAAATSADAAAEAPSSGGIGSHANCSMCDLCHGPAACSAGRETSDAPSSVARVKPMADADTGRALVGGLERPPRSRLA